MNAPVSQENRFLAHAGNGRNVFLTGMAGTGKSTLLRQFIGSSFSKVDVTAPTGVAALNVGGMTIHRFCGMLLGPQPGQTNEQYFAQLENDGRQSVRSGFHRVRRCETLVIDEISMLPGRQLDFVEFLFRRLRGRDEPFGGCQVIATGDFLQLPPVLAHGHHEVIHPSQYDWAFLSESWAAAEFKTILLETVRRQDEPEFVRALSRFRVGRVQGDDARLLQARVRSFPPANLTRLFTHNVQVDKWNEFQLSELPGEPVVCEAIQTGPETQREFLGKNLLTPATLRLKPGAIVMFTVNKNERGQLQPVFVNGQMGEVVECGTRNAGCGTGSTSPRPSPQGGEGEVVHVRLRNRDVIPVERFTWRYAQNDPESATFSQFPLRLAYAMTIHKSQGLTLDAAYLDIRAAREPGQAYVAVSRVRTLAGLNFKEWFKGLHVSPEAIRFYEENNHG
jgi:ATP-dependent exoDNAse (exonuclease V) alpha subunit